MKTKYSVKFINFTIFTSSSSSSNSDSIILVSGLAVIVADKHDQSDEVITEVDDGFSGIHPPVLTELSATVDVTRQTIDDEL